MVVKSEIKFIRSLHQKKYRNEYGMFPAEGIKLVHELIRASYKVHKIYTTEAETIAAAGIPLEVISEGDLKKISGQPSPNKVLGVFHIPPPAAVSPDVWTVALDRVQDPGNLGTIIRLCDWFDITQLVCSNDTVEAYNPKVLQATMGSIARVKVVYTDLLSFLESSGLPVYGAFMEGDVVYKENWPQAGILLMGNEARGISEELALKLSKKISIPQFGMETAESLNVAMATGILLNEIRRGEITQK